MTATATETMTSEMVFKATEEDKRESLKNELDTVIDAIWAISALLASKYVNDDDYNNTPDDAERNELYVIHDKVNRILKIAAEDIFQLKLAMI